VSLAARCLTNFANAVSDILLLRAEAQMVGVDAFAVIARMHDDGFWPSRDRPVQADPDQPMNLPLLTLEHDVTVAKRMQVAGVFVATRFREVPTPHDSRENERQSNFVGNVLPNVPTGGNCLMRHSKLFPVLSVWVRHVDPVLGHALLDETNIVTH
jgi:hypothetical protein